MEGKEAAEVQVRKEKGNEEPSEEAGEKRNEKKEEKRIKREELKKEEKIYIVQESDTAKREEVLEENKDNLNRQPVGALQRWYSRGDHHRGP